MKEYKGWKIWEVFCYTNGKSDWQIYPPHGEFGLIRPSMTLEEIKHDIDELILDEQEV